MAYIPKDIADKDEIERALKFKNPEYLSKIRFGNFFGQMPAEYLEFWEETETHYIVPRNFPDSFVLPKYKDNHTKYYITDFKPLKRGQSFVKALRPYQAEYMDKFPTIRSSEKDVLMQAPCGHGKTIMTIYRVVHVLKQKAIVLVPTNALAEQWYESFQFFTKDLVITQVVAQKKITISSLVNSDILIITNDLLRSILNTLSNNVSIVRARFRDFDDFLARTPLPPEIFGQTGAMRLFTAAFGCVVLDEYHRFGAQSWTKAIGVFSATYRITCTATPRRHDDMFRLLDMHTGKRYVLENQFAPADVYYIKTTCEVFPEFNHLAEKRLRDAKEDIESFRKKKAFFYEWINANGLSNKVSPEGYYRINAAKAIDMLRGIPREYHKSFERALSYAEDKLMVGAIETQVVENSKRVKLILSVIQYAIDSGRTVLVLSKRRQVLVTWHNLFTKKGYKSCVIVGGAKGTSKNKANLKYAQESAQVIWGIDRLAKEGLDIERLDTLITIHPISDMEQAVGRTIRVAEDKKQPIVIGFSDPIPVFEGIIRKGNKNIGHAKYKGFITKEQAEKILER